MWGRRKLSVAAGLAALVTASPVWAQNIDRFYLGGDAALQGGAVTADVRGGGGIWYNPASLAKLPSLRFDVDMAAYALGFGGQPDLEGATDQAVATRLTSLDLRGVPAGMSLTHNAGRFGIGFGLFVPTQTTSYLRTRIVDPGGPGIAPVDFGVDVTTSEYEYFGGPSVGFALSSKVDIGFSLLVHYRSELQIAGIDLALGDTDAPALSLLTHTTRDWIQVGLQPVLGVQLRPFPLWRFGITLRLPSFRLYQVLQTVELETTAVQGAASHSSNFIDGTGFAASMVKPPRIHFGASREFGKVRLAAELSYQFPLLNLEIEQDLRPLINARLGGQRRINDGLAIGGGIFTNRSAKRRVQEFGDKQIDFYGVTIAAELGTPYEIRRRGGKFLTPFGKLNFGTTVALTYSFGTGTIVHAKVGASNNGAELIQTVPADVIAHEVMFSLGSSLQE